MSNGTFWHSKTDIASNNDELGDSKTSRIPPSSSTSSSSSQPISIQAATASSTLFMTNSSNGCCSYSEVVQLVVKSIKRKSTYRVMEVDFIVDDSSRMETIVVKLSAAASDPKNYHGIKVLAKDYQCKGRWVPTGAGPTLSTIHIDPTSRAKCVHAPWQQPSASRGSRGSLDYRLAKLDISGQKEFAQCSLPLYPPSASVLPSKPLGIPSDTPTRFVFEMPLPNRDHDPGADQESLIQSIRCKEFHVNYHIRAILQYETQTDGKKKKKLVVIHRSRPQPVTIVHIPTFDDSSTYFTSDNMLASIDSRKQTNHWCQYRVQVDKRFAAISSMLSLSIRIAPLVQGLKLGQASMHIVQRFTMTETSQTFSRPPIPLLCVFQSTPYPSAIHTGGTLYEGDFHYKIPSSTTSINGLVPSMKASNITIDHHLVVHITLTYPKVSHDGILRRARRVLTFKSDFDLLHSFMAQPDEMLRLPAYDTAVDHPSSLAIEFLQTCQSSPPLYDQALLLPPTLIR